MCCRSRGRTLLPSALALLLPLLLPAAGCGKKGNPLPPLRAIPAPVRDLAVEQRGRELRLGFTYPKLTPAGTALEGVTAVEVWEAVRPVPPGGTPRALAAREFTAAAKQRLRLAGAEVGAATSGDRILVTLPLPDPLPAAPEAHHFAVRTAGPQGDLSEYSLPVVAVPQTPPEAPRDVRVTPRGDGILVEWEPVVAPAPAPAPAPSADATGATTASPAPAPGTPPAPAEGSAGSPAPVPPPGAAGEAAAPSTPQVPAPPGSPAPAASAAAAPAPTAPAAIVGYNLYRRSSRDRSYGAALQMLGPEAKSAVDPTARFGESYIYAVTAVARRTPLLESAVQSEHEVRYQDRFPPPVPREPLALSEGGRVRLVWRSSEAPDLAGYLVYRSDAGGPFARLTERPLAALEYSDPGVPPGPHAYRVTAVDQLGNESVPAEVGVTVQRGPG